MASIYADSIAVVTGAASGIGRELAAQLTAAGARVWLADIDEAGLERAVAQLGGQAARLDVTDAAAVQELVDAVVAEAGRLDYMFNNAGIAVIGHYDQMSLDDINRLIDVNLRGVVHGVAAAYPVMIRQRAGHIVNTSSVSGLIAAPGFTAYSATKHAVVGLSRGLRLEAARYGVKVSSICPGFIETSIKQNADYRGIDPDKGTAKLPFRFHSAQYCAEQALRGVARDEAEIVITPHAKGMVAMQRFAPRLNEWLGRTQINRTVDD